MPDCPYFKSKVDKLQRINCKRGLVPQKFEGKGYGKQLNRFCNGGYMQCWCYKFLELAWGRERK